MRSFFAAASTFILLSAAIKANAQPAETRLEHDSTTVFHNIIQSMLLLAAADPAQRISFDNKALSLMLEAVEADFSGQIIHQPVPSYLIICAGCNCPQTCCTMCPCTSHAAYTAGTNRTSTERSRSRYVFTSPVANLMKIRFRDLQGKLIRTSNSKMSFNGANYTVWELDPSSLPERLTVEIVVRQKARKLTGSEKKYIFEANYQDSRLSIEHGQQ